MLGSVSSIVRDQLFKEWPNTVIAIGPVVPPAAHIAGEPEQTALVFRRLDLASVLPVRQLEPDDRDPVRRRMIGRNGGHAPEERGDPADSLPVPDDDDVIRQRG